LAATAYAGGWERPAWLAAAALIQLRLLANLAQKEALQHVVKASLPWDNSSSTNAGLSLNNRIALQWR
jgi:hypothetical protein